MMNWKERGGPGCGARASKRWPAAALLALACALPAPLVRAQLPTLGDTSEMNSSAERKLGERVARELYRDPDYIDDLVLDEYIHDIWQRLLGKDRIINAFALPGGWLGLQLGLINVTATPDELASVLAHELSHVTQRHISRLTTQENRQAP